MARKPKQPEPEPDDAQPGPLTPEQIEEVEKLAAVLNQEQLGDFFGVTGRTFRRWMDADDAVRSAYKKGRANAIGKVGAKLLGKALAGDTVSMIFYLKCQGRWRERHEIGIGGLEDDEGVPASIPIVFVDAPGSGDGDAES